MAVNIGPRIGVEGEKEYRDQLNNIIQRTKALAAEMKALESSFSKGASAQDKAAAKAKLLSEQTSLQRERVEQLNEMYQKSLEKYGELDNKTLKWKTALNEARAELNRLESAEEDNRKTMEEFGESMEDSGKSAEEAKEKLSAFGDVLKANLASEAIISGVKAIARGIKDAAEAAIDAGSAFEAGMSKVEAISGASAEEMQKLSDLAKEMGANTQFSASQSAEALSYMAMAGWKTEQMLNGLPGVMNLAAASGEDLATTSDIVTDALTAFGMTAEESGHFADVLAASSANANTNVSMLGESFQYAAPIAGALGYSAEDAALALGLMANAGVKASSAGTALRSIMTRLVTPTSDAAVWIKKLGVEVKNQDGTMRPFNEVIKSLRQGFSGLSEAEKAAAANAIAGKFAMSGLLAVVNGADADFSKLEGAIKNADGTAERMAKTMNNNLKGKVTLLQSALEGLSITLYDVFDDELKRGVDSASDAVGRLQDEIEHGELGVSLDNLARALGNFLEGTVELGEKALPALVDGLAWIVDHADIILSVMAGFAAASAISKAVAAYMSLQEALKGTTIAQAALNMVMEANPIGILITAVGALAAGLTTLAVLSDGLAGEMNEVSQESMDAAENAKKVVESVEQAKDSYKDQATKLEAQEGIIKKLVSRLQELQSKTSLSNTEQAEMKRIVDELNAALPELNLALDEHGKLIGQDTDQLKLNIETMMEQAKYTAIQERMNEIAKERLDLESEQLTLTNQLAAAQNEYNAAKAEFENSSMSGKGFWEGYVGEDAEAANARFMNARDALNELKEASDGVRESLAGLDEEEKNLTAQAEEAYAGIAAAQEELSVATEELGGKFAGMSEEMVSEYMEMQEAAMKSIGSQMDMFSKFSATVAPSTQELLANMQSQVDGVRAWSENLDKLAKGGIEDGLLHYLQDMGPKGAEYVQQFVDMMETSAAEFQQANQLWLDGMAVQEDAATIIADSYFGLGQQAAQGAIDGMGEMTEPLAEATSTMTQGSIDAMKETLQAYDAPSEVTKEIGKYVDTGFSMGMTEGGRDVVKDIEILIQGFADAMKKEIEKQDFKKIGLMLPKGLAEGIREGKSEVINAAIEVAAAAAAAAKAELQISSPSKVFDEEIGRMIDRGMVQGIRAEMPDVSRAFEGLTSFMQLPSLPSSESTGTLNSILSSISALGSREQDEDQEIELSIKLEADEDQLFRVTQKRARMFRKSTGQEPY